MKMHLAAPLFLALLLGGCQSAVPSEADGRAVIESRTARGSGFSGSAIRLAKFRKTNGQDRAFGGVRMYEMEYEAEFECLERVSSLDLMNICAGRQPGSTVTQRGRLRFEKTERGWRDEDGNVH